MLKVPTIEVDVDGVVGNIVEEEYVRQLISDLVPDYSDEMNTSYGLDKVLCPEAYARVRASFVDPTHLLTMPRYPNVVDAVRRLAKCGHVIFHTLILAKEAVPARRQWLEELISDAGIDADILIDVGQKITIESDILIEDNPSAFFASKAKMKVMILHPYNEKAVVPNIYRTNSLETAATLIEERCLVSFLMNRLPSMPNAANDNDVWSDGTCFWVLDGQIAKVAQQFLNRTGITCIRGFMPNVGYWFLRPIQIETLHHAKNPVEDLLGHLTDDSFSSDFWIEGGKVKSYDANQQALVAFLSAIGGKEYT